MNNKGATVQHLTVEQAIAYNKALPKYNRQSTLQLKNWYKQGYCLLSKDLRWYYFCTISNKYYLKYYTGG